MAHVSTLHRLRAGALLAAVLSFTTALAGCDATGDGAPPPGTPPPGTTPPGTTPPGTTPPPGTPPSGEAALPAAVTFRDGLQAQHDGPDLVVAAPGCAVSIPAMPQPTLYALEAGVLALGPSAFDLTLTLRRGAGPAVTHVLAGSLERWGPVLRLTPQGRPPLYATLGPDASTSITTVSVADPNGVLRGSTTNCRVYRFATGAQAEAGVEGSAAAAAYAVETVRGGAPLPHAFQVLSYGVMRYDSMDVRLDADGTYTSTLYHRFDGGPTVATTAQGRHVGTGAVRALDPGLARVSFLDETGALPVLRGNGLPFSAVGAPIWEGARSPAYPGVDLRLRPR